MCAHCQCLYSHNPFSKEEDKIKIYNNNKLAKNWGSCRHLRFSLELLSWGFTYSFFTSPLVQIRLVWFTPVYSYHLTQCAINTRAQSKYSFSSLSSCDGKLPRLRWFKGSQNFSYFFLTFSQKTCNLGRGIFTFQRRTWPYQIFQLSARFYQYQVSSFFFY